MTRSLTRLSMVLLIISAGFISDGAAQAQQKVRFAYPSSDDVGDIPSMDEQAEQAIVRREDGSYLLDGSLSIDLLKATLDFKQLPGEESGDFQTLGGFIMTRLGRVPAVADQLEVGGWRFEVMDMDRKRVDKVLATRIPS